MKNALIKTAIAVTAAAGCLFATAQAEMPAAEAAGVEQHRVEMNDLISQKLAEMTDGNILHLVNAEASQTTAASNAQFALVNMENTAPMATVVVAKYDVHTVTAD